MNATDYGGGTPVADIWRRDAGLAVGHLDLKPKVVSLPVAMPDASRAEIRIEFKGTRSLAPGATLETLRTFVAAHKGDYFTVLEHYRKMMIAQGVRLPESPVTHLIRSGVRGATGATSSRARSTVRCRS